MASLNSRSLFSDIRSRELSGLRVRKRPYIEDFVETGAFAVELEEGKWQPPVAVSFCKTSKHAHILAVSNDFGFVSLFDTRKKTRSSASIQENSEEARVSVWEAHNNSVFDVCWIKDDTQIFTASGDQTVKLWDVQEKKCITVLKEHEGSVKSLSSHPTNTDLIVSGARDGTFALWDLRCNSKYLTRHADPCMSPIAAVKVAHPQPLTRRARSRKAPKMGITSVLYLKDEVSIATAAAAESAIKFWDTRNLKKAITQTRPHSESSQKNISHGISSLSQDLNGVFLSASCMDNRIYLYNVLQLDKGPIKSFSGGGCILDSFYVKTSISHDAAYILSGSRDGNAYIWQVDNPQEDPVKLALRGREVDWDREVTAVDWCPAEVGKLAACSDDCSVRIWNTKARECSSIRPPSSVRRRIMAIPTENMKVTMDEVMALVKERGTLCPSDKQLAPYNSLPEVRTPEGQKKRVFISSSIQETCEKTPDNASDSPSSVLNPPPSLKRRTIRDYFSAASM